MAEHLGAMNMYDEHLSDNDSKSSQAADGGSAQHAGAAWPVLCAAVSDAMARLLPVDGEAAQALALRWMRLAAQTKRIEADPAMLRWIGEAFIHARCHLFAKHLSRAQTDEVRRRQLAGMSHMQAWPALVAELRAQMEAESAIESPAVQDIVKRWQQLFRDSYCGDDAALESAVREALVLEPELQLGVGMDEALLTYLHRAHVVAHHVPLANAGPKPSALMVAVQRAAHQLVDTPRVFDDSLAIRILGPEGAEALTSDLGRFREPLALGLRSSVVVRSRFAEDEWAAAIERGVRQYVVLGAGLDTSVYRHPDTPGRMFEVDLPTTQAWKRARLKEAGIETPPSLQYVPVDFETISLAQGLARAGFDASRPAFFSWLGVSMYLDEASIIQTLRFIGRGAPGTSVVFDYITPFASLPMMMRVAMEQLAARLAASGEPWKTHFEPAALADILASLGFSQSRSWAPEELNARYLAGRTDGLHMGPGPGRFMHATV